MSQPSSSHPRVQVQSSFSPAALVDGVASSADLLLRFRLPPTHQRRRPLNLALVIDRSGSMAGQNLKQAILAAKRVVDDLDENDLLSVVIYDDAVETLISPTHVTDKAHLKGQLDRIRAGGLTNLSGGWLRGMELVQQGSTPDMINRVLLLTDGQANVGVTDIKVLTKTAAQKAEAGISTTALGFGQSFNEDLLIGMARAAGGNFYFIQSIDDAAEVFGIELQTLKAVAAQNLTVTLEPAAGVEIRDVLSLHRRQDAPGTAWTLELGDVYEDEDKLLGLQLTLPALTAGTHSLLKVSYRAEVVHDGNLETLRGDWDVQAAAAPLEAEHGAGDLGVTLDLARLRIARAKERAVELSDQGQAAEAVAVLRDLAGQLRTASLDEHFEIAEELEQLEHYASRISARRLDNESRKELRDQSFQGRGRGREDLLGRGLALDTAVFDLPVVQQMDQGVGLVCVRSGGKLRVKAVSDGFDAGMNVQFPRALRAEGAHYVVDNLVHSADGSFYRIDGTISRIVRAGETDPLTRPSGGGRASSAGHTRAAAVTKAAKTVADLETTDSARDGILLQCVKEGSKLRARVVQDGYHPDWNMRFPRSIREEGTLYVVDEVNTAPDGKSYIASGAIRRFVQPS